MVQKIYKLKEYLWFLFGRARFSSISGRLFVLRLYC